jgi:hypothetical protein
MRFARHGLLPKCLSMRNQILWALLLASSWVQVSATSALCAVCTRQTDSLALVSLYQATDGANWTVTWNLQNPMTTWAGVLLDPGGCVRSIVLINNGLNGVLPASLGTLSDLRLLYLFGNFLNGPIPPELGQLGKIEDLVLENNQLTGNIPQELGMCSSLKTLSLGNNFLDGELPAALGNLTELVTLVLSNNALTGSIPSSLGSLAKLGVLDLRRNQFGGSLPASLGQLSSLREFYVQNNRLSGTIPASMGNLIQMNHFWVFDNDFTGEVPDLRAAPLASFRIEDNRFSGIPDYSTVQTWGNSFPFGLIITGNAFTFEDLLPLKKIHPRFYYDFDPQDPVAIDSLQLINEGSQYIVQTFVDPGITENNYKWFKDTSLVFISNRNTYEILQSSEADEGYYSGRITHPEISNFEIRIAPFRLVVYDPLRCDKPLAGERCDSAIAFCSTSELHKYCGSLGNPDTAIHYFLCDSSIPVNNPRWMSFVAPSDSLFIEVIPSDCAGIDVGGTTFRGMQAAVWSSCGQTPDSILLCHSDCTEGPIRLSSNAFQIGQTYRLVVNGCMGDNCNYLVVMRHGRKPFELAEPGPIVGENSICADGSVHAYHTNLISGATTYQWFLDDTLVASTPDSAVELIDLEPGEYLLRVRAVNFCDTTHFSIFPLKVNTFLRVADLSVTTLARDSAFVVSFTIIGGVKPYLLVLGRGTIDTATGRFTSDILLCKSAYEFEIRDTSGCQVTVAGFERCGCNGVAGSMPQDSLTVCEGQTFAVQYTGPETRDSGDLAIYILYTDPLNPAGSIIRSNGSGIFPFDPARFRFNVWYYVSRVVGRRNAKGELNFLHPCLSISNFQPVIFRPKPLVSAGPDRAACGTASLLEAFGNFTTGEWKLVSGPGLALFADARAPLTTVEVDSLGDYTFAFEVTNGYCPGKDELRIRFQEGLHPVIGGYSSVCEGQHTELDGGNFERYKWSTGDTTRMLRVDAPGTYCLTVSDASGCSGSTCLTVVLANAPSASLVAPDSLCTGDRAIILLSEPYTSYRWSDGTSAPFLPIDTGGRYCVTVTATNGCTDEACYDVASKSRSFRFFRDTACYGSTYTYLGRSFSTEGTHDIALDGAAPNGCDSIIRLQLHWWPELIVADTLIFPDDGTRTGVISVVMAGGVPPYQYLWSNGSRTPGIANLISGNYQLFVTDAKDCVAVFNFFVPKAVGTSGSTGTNKMPRFAAFPTPAVAGGSLYIENHGSPCMVHINLFDVWGRNYCEQTFVSFMTDDQHRITLPESPGLYHLLITDEFGKIHFAKILTHDR